MRQRNIFFIIFLSCSIPLVADEVELRLCYLCGEREVEGENYLKAVDMTLDIGQMVSRFYYRDTIDHTKYPSSDPRGRKTASYSILKNYPSEGLLVYAENFTPNGKIYRYEEEMPQWEWELQEGDSIILGYPCKKATAYFRGRTWIAWYAIDLPYDSGPWKMNGLPGLILYAHDIERSFFFRCNRIEKGDGTPIEEEKRNYVKIIPKRLNEIKGLRITDYNTFYFETTGIVMKTSFNDPLLKERKPCFIETYE